MDEHNQHGHNMSRTTMASHTNDGNSHQTHGGDFMSGHHMFFHLRDTVPVLFQQWHITTPTAMVLSCLGVFFLAIIYEMMKTVRNRLQPQQNNVAEHNSSVTSDVPADLSNGMQVCDISTRSSPKRSVSIINCWHILQSFLHLLQVFIGLVLMLVAMTFNVWLFLSVVVGTATGYFFSVLLSKTAKVGPPKSPNNAQLPTFQLTTTATYGNQGVH